jgi:hypothetical protein
MTETLYKSLTVTGTGPYSRFAQTATLFEYLDGTRT